MKNKIEFVSILPELLNDESVLPKPTSKHIPEWFKKAPLKSYNSELFGRSTIKACPAIADLFSTGYIVTAWNDIALHYKDGMPSGKMGRHGSESIGVHPNDQFLDYVEHDYFGKEGKFVFKLDSPWHIITPKGWSVLQLPLLYNFDKNFSIMSGIIDTDIWHQANLQLIYYGESEVVIPKGTPLVQYIPFKRQNTKLITRAATKEDSLRFEKARLIVESKFVKGYLQLKRNRDND